MIEMRWLVPIEGEKKLQYRQQNDLAVQFGIINDNGKHTSWSEWREVPVVAERDPSFP